MPELELLVLDGEPLLELVLDPLLEPPLEAELEPLLEPLLELALEPPLEAELEPLLEPLDVEPLLEPPELEPLPEPLDCWGEQLAPELEEAAPGQKLWQDPPKDDWRHEATELESAGVQALLA